VVDPGHGGDDVGVVGMGGTQEKTLTLAIAQRLKTTLETQLGVRVLLTRTDDRAVGLDQRAAVANNSRADLFLSLHLNASAVAEMTGAEVFHQRLSRDGEGALRRAGRGASVLPVFGGAPRTIEVVRWDLAHTRHVARSTLLADLLQEQLGMRVAMSPRPNREAPLRVLTSVDMPAALIEMAYLTNSGQEGEIQSDAYQTSLVGAIADAVAQFRSSVDEREAQ
jgi:N-acetylmuramoyl-L-alanine amidase